MSAFIVSDRHIDALLTWVINTPKYQAPQILNGMTVKDQPDLIGQMLVELNYRSVNTRYNENDQPREYKFRPFPRTISPVEVIKACDCLNYQCCEFEGWKDTKAARIIDEIRESAIDSLPGMDAAAWEIN